MIEEQRPRDVWLGFKIGIFAAMLYGVFAVVVWLFHRAQLRAEGLSIFTILLSYLLAGISGGALLGFLFPLTTDRSGSVIVGVLAFSPAALCVGVTLGGLPWTWTGANWFAFFMTASLLGGWAGYYFWTPVGGTPTSEQRPESASNRRPSG